MTCLGDRARFAQIEVGVDVCVSPPAHPKGVHGQACLGVLHSSWDVLGGCLGFYTVYFCHVWDVLGGCLGFCTD